MARDKRESKDDKNRKAYLEQLAATQATPVEPETYLGDLRLALTLADQVDELTLARFGARDLNVEQKDDSTPVTDADLAAEEFLREQLGRTRPDDAVLGEEFGGSKASKLAKIQTSGARAWVLDPIDGTASYARGIPVWATLIGLVADGRAAVGVVSAPALGARWFAAAGYGAWKGSGLDSARRLAVSKTKKLGEAFLSYSSVANWEDQGRLAGFVRLLGDVGSSRGFGDFWSYMLVAEGAADIATEPELAPHDMVALAPIVTEAGGRFTDSRGTVTGPFGADGLATNGRLHDRVTPYLRGKGSKAA
ncbi:MAG: histidinol phosphatase [Bifidobacteriaceae bacterium]|jgi:histidinol-phosphatase|nr:histidinol phosphatase [Bifidobacteriaceae bacterium]